MQAAVAGPVGMLRHAPAWLHAISHLHPVAEEQEGTVPATCSRHVQQVMQRFKDLVEAQLEVNAS